MANELVCGYGSPVWIREELEAARSAAVTERLKAEAAQVAAERRLVEVTEERDALRRQRDELQRANTAEVERRRACEGSLDAGRAAIFRQAAAISRAHAKLAELAHERHELGAQLDACRETNRQLAALAEELRARFADLRQANRVANDLCAQMEARAIAAENQVADLRERWARTLEIWDAVAQPVAIAALTCEDLEPEGVAL